MRLGDRIADYMIERALGEGGMGTVYLASHSILDQQVAIKILDPEVARKPGIRERFIQEANIQAKLKHPHIVQVLTATNVERGIPALIMEYVEGKSLSEVLELRGALPIDDALKIMEQVLSAVGYAHKLGVIHRDLKPSNVMVMANGEAKVMDFGIAKVLGSSKLTRTGTAMGSAHYMSPEQIRRPETVDARSDIYSLGCVFYEVLTGRPPFGKKEFLGTESDFEVKTAHIAEAVPALEIVNSGTPKWLVTLVMSMLEKEPDERPRSCEEIVEKLKAALTDKEILVGEPINQSDRDIRDCESDLDSHSKQKILLSKAIFPIGFLIIIVLLITLSKDKTKSVMPPAVELSAKLELPPESETPKPASDPKSPSPAVAVEQPQARLANPDLVSEQEKNRNRQKEQEQLAEEQKRQKEEQALKDKRKLEEEQKQKQKQEAAEAEEQKRKEAVATEEQKRKQEAAAAEENKRRQEAAAAEENKRKQEQAGAKPRRQISADEMDAITRQAGDGAAGKAGKAEACERYLGTTVKSNISFPDVGGNAKVIVVIRLNDNRMPEEVTITEPSGNAAFDKQVERGVRKSGPFPRECPNMVIYSHYLKPR